MHYRIVAIVQIYNEIEKGNLERFLQYVLPEVDDLVVYDDASTDGSYERALRVTPHVLRGAENNFAAESSHKKKLLDYARKLNPDFILWIDADEVLTYGARAALQRECARCVTENLDGIQLHEWNLWRSRAWRRVDSEYDDGWFTRLWRVTPQLGYPETLAGLHHNPVPPMVQRVARATEVAMIHYGFATEKAIAEKYLTYRDHGQWGYHLDRLINETQLKLVTVPSEFFPADLRVSEAAPTALSHADSFRMLERYKNYPPAPSSLPDVKIYVVEEPAYERSGAMRALYELWCQDRNVEWVEPFGVSYELRYDWWFERWRTGLPKKPGIIIQSARHAKALPEGYGGVIHYAETGVLSERDHYFINQRLMPFNWVVATSYVGATQVCYHGPEVIPLTDMPVAQRAAEWRRILAECAAALPQPARGVLAFDTKAVGRSFRRHVLRRFLGADYLYLREREQSGQGIRPMVERIKKLFLR